MTDGQFIAVDLGNGKGKRLQVRDLGNGHYTASDPLNGWRVMSVEPTSGAISWSEAGATGEYERFTADGGAVICFYSTNGNPTGAARLFGFSGTVKGIDG